MENSIYWLIILAILLVIEMVTLGLTTIWFAGGALVAFIVSLFIDNILIEVLVCLIVSTLLLIFTRPLAMKYFTPKRTMTNYEGVIGKEAIVIISIDNLSGVGQVMVDGVEWSAKSADGQILEKGTSVVVDKVQGVKLVVSLERKEL